MVTVWFPHILEILIVVANTDPLICFFVIIHALIFLRIPLFPENVLSANIHLVPCSAYIT